MPPFPSPAAAEAFQPIDMGGGWFVSPAPAKDVSTAPPPAPAKPVKLTKADKLALNKQLAAAVISQDAAEAIRLIDQGAPLSMSSAKDAYDVVSVAIQNFNPSVFDSVVKHGRFQLVWPNQMWTAIHAGAVQAFSHMLNQPLSAWEDGKSWRHSNHAPGSFLQYADLYSDIFNKMVGEHATYQGRPAVALALCAMCDALDAKLPGVAQACITSTQSPRNLGRALWCVVNLSEEATSNFIRHTSDSALAGADWKSWRSAWSNLLEGWIKSPDLLSSATTATLNRLSLVLQENPTSCQTFNVSLSHMKEQNAAFLSFYASDTPDNASQLGPKVTQLLQAKYQAQNSPQFGAPSIPSYLQGSNAASSIAHSIKVQVGSLTAAYKDLGFPLGLCVRMDLAGSLGASIPPSAAPEKRPAHLTELLLLGGASAIAQALQDPQSRSAIMTCLMDPEVMFHFCKNASKPTFGAFLRSGPDAMGWTDPYGNTPAHYRVIAAGYNPSKTTIETIGMCDASVLLQKNTAGLTPRDILVSRKADPEHLALLDHKVVRKSVKELGSVATKLNSRPKTTSRRM